SLHRIDLEVEVAGQVFRQSFAALSNQSYTFAWDGKDAYGRTVQGVQAVTVRLGYVYGAVYQTPAALKASFGYNGNGNIAGNAARTEVTLWQTFQTGLGHLDATDLGLGGWSLSEQHVYDPSGRVLDLGNGDWRNQASLAANTITT